jgi:uncharacterized protein YeaO (DUF488 family)
MLKLRTFQIGTPRKKGEGLRIGAVRYLPRGVKKENYARLDYFDVWYPQLAPSQELIQWLHSVDEKWGEFRKRYEREMMKNTDSRQAIQLLAQIATRTPIAIGCYCDDEEHCHRSALYELIKRSAAQISL